MNKHERLSEALCEAVEFGHPEAIVIGQEDFFFLLADIDAASGHKIDLQDRPRFEDVPVTIERDRQGCIVKHDGRYLSRVPTEPVKAIPETVAFDRRTRKPVIVAW